VRPWQGGYARLTVRAGHDETVGWARAASLPCRVSPDLAGWVGVCFLDDGAGRVTIDGQRVDQVAEAMTAALGCVGVLSVLYDPAVLRLVAYDRGAEAGSLVSRPDGGGPAAWQAAGELAERCGRPEAAESVAAVLADTELGAVERHRRASEALGLPAHVVGQTLLGAPGQVVDAVVTRARQAEVMFAATVTKLDGWVVPVGEWVVAVARDHLVSAASPPTAAGMLPFAGAVSGAQRSPALYLWQDGAAGGYAVFRKGRLLDAHAWGDAWEVVAFDDETSAALGPPLGDAALLAAAFDRREAEVALRALTRRRDDPARLHDEMCELLGVPPVALELARARRDPAEMPGAQQPEPMSAARAIWRAATEGRPSDSRLRRLSRERPVWYRALNAVLTSLFLVVGGTQILGWRDGGSAWRLALGAWLLVCGLVCAWYVRPGGDLPAGR
jgi:hypothetical protein